MKRTLSLLIFLSYVKAYALDMGSERFSTFMEGSSPYSTLVDMGKNNSITSNLPFTDTEYVSAISDFPFPEGSGQKYAVANMMNFQGNYNWAAAKTDPRSSAFIMNSMDKLSSDPNAEMELAQGLTASKLDAAQAGEMAKKYIASEIITPNVGYYQTSDNQESFESAYDNVLLGQAEESLFKGDEASSLSYFNSKIADFKESSDKQNSAGSFQKDGLLRSKKTAETFRDFFQLKSTISQQNLSNMPTQSSLLNNCQSNSPSGANINRIYDVSMPSSEAQFYNFPTPQYNFDFCEQYIHNESAFLIQNEPVRNQLETIIQDSEEMAEGLNEISTKLSDQSLEVDQIANALSNSPAWKTLSERAQAYRECAEKNCLETAKKTLGSMVTYPGYERHQSQSRKEIQAILNNIKQSGSMPGDTSNLIQKYSSTIAAVSSQNKKGRTKSTRRQNSRATKLSPEDDASSAESGIASQSLSGLSDSYKKRSYTDSIYYRDEQGTLRGPSGKPVQGYYGTKDKSLFDIISRRYLIQVQKGDL